MAGLNFSRRNLLRGIGLAPMVANFMALRPSAAWSWFAPKDLSREVFEYKAACALLKHPEARMGSVIAKKPPGRLYSYALARKVKAGKVLFETPARCADDVIRKYMTLEETQYRVWWFYSNRYKLDDGVPLTGPWFEQLEADLKRFPTDINPWWRDDTPNFAMVDGRHVYFDEGVWQEHQNIGRTHPDKVISERPFTSDIIPAQFRKPT